MKFSELSSDSWPDLQPYLDTCLLPVSGLTGEESPPQLADKIAETGKWLAPLEQSFNGRTVTLPAYHYWSGAPEEEERLAQLCEQQRRNGFRFVIVVCGQPGLLLKTLPVDLLVGPSDQGDTPESNVYTQQVVALWNTPRRGGLSN